MPDERPLREVPPSDLPGWPDWMEQWVLPYVKEPALWPVLVALLGHVVVGISPLMLAVWRSANPSASVALMLLLAASLGLVGFEVRRFGRPGGVTLTCCSTWLVSVLIAAIAERTGVF